MQESGEMYLETILTLGESNPGVRAIDVVNAMGFSKPSVSKALGKLRQDGCILVDEGGHITLTERGRVIAERIYERHVVLSGMLTALGVPREIALADACKMEHDLSDETFEAIKAHWEQRVVRRGETDIS